MLQIVLLAGKFVFLVVLYLFIYRVIRSASRELRTVGPVADRRQWPSELETPSVGGGAAVVAGVPAPGKLSPPIFSL